MLKFKYRDNKKDKVNMKYNGKISNFKIYYILFLFKIELLLYIKSIMTNNKIDKLLSKIKNLDIKDDDKNEIIQLIDNLKNNEKKLKKEKDPNMPKRPKNGFMLFMDDIRKIKDNKKHGTHFPSDYLEEVKNIIKSNEGKPATNLSKDCGGLWRKLTDKEKIKYENVYKKSLDKYKKDIEKYKKDNIQL